VAWEVFVHPGQEIDFVVLAVGVIESSPCAKSDKVPESFA
jgi:hypothetical protein